MIKNYFLLLLKPSSRKLGFGKEVSTSILKNQIRDILKLVNQLIFESLSNTLLRKKKRKIYLKKKNINIRITCDQIC
jgi:hypothetical protein